MIDTSHGNSGRDPARQADVVDSVIRQKRSGDRAIRALMIKAISSPAAQDPRRNAFALRPGITDACLGFADTEALLHRLADGLTPR
jgi:3-deoxy-7-phosphoheptulonate synthase